MDKVLAFKLSEPIATLSGDTVTDMTLDFGKIRAIDFGLLSRMESKLGGGGGDGMTPTLGTLSKALNTNWRLAYAWLAACRGTKGLCIDDIEKISVPDALDLADAALPFVSRQAI